MILATTIPLFMAISPCLRELWHITASPSRDRAHSFACTAHCAVCAACRWAHGACSSCNPMFPELLMLAGQHQLVSRPVPVLALETAHLAALCWFRCAQRTPATLLLGHAMRRMPCMRRADGRVEPAAPAVQQPGHHEVVCAGVLRRSAPRRPRPRGSGLPGGRVQRSLRMFPRWQQPCCCAASQQ